MNEKTARDLIYKDREKLSFSEQDLSEDWKRVRGLIEHEDSLINQRVTWLITLNAFLFSAFAFLQVPSSLPENLEITTYLLSLIPSMGIILSYTIKSGIEAAMDQIKHTNLWWLWRKSLDDSNYGVCKDDSLHLKHPRLTGLTPNKWFDHDFMIAKAIPWTLILCWVFLLVGMFGNKLTNNLQFTAPVWVWALVPIIAVAVAYLFGRRKKIFEIFK